VPQRLALLVGVDRYPFLPEENQLRSCANDARLMGYVLRERFGFAEEGLTLLLDEAATREGILAGLRDLLKRAREGDSIVFYFSGHGSQTPDEDGDEADGMDETLVPYDSGRYEHPSRDIIDDEIHEWILEASAVTPYITLIADTCFSGGVARGPREKWIEPDRRLPTTSRLHTRSGTGSPRNSNKGPSRFLPLSERYALLAACRFLETAKELTPIPGEREPYSAFTYFLCQELLRAPAEATYRDILEPTRAAVVAATMYTQTPQLEGARDRLLFGVQGSEPARYFLIESRAGDRVHLGGGAVHGISLGSLWTIHPSGTRQAGDTAPLGTVRVVAVRGVSAEAEIVEESSPIQPPARAFEREKGADWHRLPVSFDPAGLDPSMALNLAQRLRRSEDLRLIEGGGDTEHRIVILNETSWAVLGGNGGLLIPPIPLRHSGAVARLVDDLETRARLLWLLKLTDDSENNPLRDCLDVRLLCRAADGSFREAEPDPVTGEIVYRAGEYLALRIVHRANVPLYIHVLDLGVAGGITLLHPVAGNHKPLLPKRTFDIGVERRIKLRLPEPYREGKEFLKVFATTHEADLSVHQQPGYGSPPASRSRQGHALAHGEEERWTVVTQGFLVRGSGE